MPGQNAQRLSQFQALAVFICLIGLPVFGHATESNIQRIETVIKASDEARISAQTDAQIAAIHFDIGDAFQKDDILIEFECAAQIARQKKAKAEYDAADQQYKAYQRLKELSSASDLKLSLSRSEMESAKAEYELQTALADRCQIKAPYDGYVVDVNANSFENAKPGQPVIHIISRVRLTAQIILPSALYTNLEVGDTIEIDVKETGKTYQAKVDQINAQIDAVSGSFLMVASISANDAANLVPGMSGYALIPLHNSGE